jgi:hypothetical protein
MESPYMLTSISVPAAAYGCDLADHRLSSDFKPSNPAVPAIKSIASNKPEVRIWHACIPYNGQLRNRCENRATMITSTADHLSER